MKILFTICARKGSKGLKNKNITNFLGYPICYYTLSSYDLFKKYNPQFECDLAVNTDSDVLPAQINSTTIEYISVIRKEELSGDNANKIEVISDTYKKVNKNYDFVIDLDLTSPLRTSSDIKGVLDELIKNPDAALSFSVTSPRRSPYFNQVRRFDDGFFAPVNFTNDDKYMRIPEVYDMSPSIYVYRSEFLQQEINLFDAKCCAFKIHDTAVLDIDNSEDKDLMEIIADYFYNQYPNYSKVKDNIKNIIKK